MHGGISNNVLWEIWEEPKSVDFLFIFLIFDDQTGKIVKHVTHRVNDNDTNAATTITIVFYNNSRAYDYIVGLISI